MRISFVCESTSASSVEMCSQTCIKRSPLGQRKGGLLRQVTCDKQNENTNYVVGHSIILWSQDLNMMETFTNRALVKPKLIPPTKSEQSPLTSND